MDCESFLELGPPPDFLSIPPPPVPLFMDVSYLGSDIVVNALSYADDTSCNLCQWAAVDGVGYIELAQKGPLIDDTWFFIIISLCVGLTLAGIVFTIGCLKYREGKLKPLSDIAIAKKEKALGLERCEAVLYPSQSIPDIAATRALWAGLKSLEGNHYTVDHCQPVNQKQARLDLLPPHEHTYDYADYNTLAYSMQLGNHQTIGNHQTENFNGGIYLDDSRNETGRTTVGVRIKEPPHHYEMVHKPKQKSMDRKSNPTISSPTAVPVMLPPLNSRFNQYNITALANGSHTLSPYLSKRDKQMRVSLDKYGNSTTLAKSPASEHIYASPITSPVI